MVKGIDDMREKVFSIFAIVDKEPIQEELKIDSTIVDYPVLPNLE